MSGELFVTTFMYHCCLYFSSFSTAYNCLYRAVRATHAAWALMFLDLLH